MSKLWNGRFNKEVDEIVNDFNSSIPFDQKMYKQDILGSIAHVTMLGECEIIDKSDSISIVDSLNEILKEIEAGTLLIDSTAEDIHSVVESELTKRLGDTGKRLHTARSRNDQVALDLRMYLVEQIKSIKELIVNLLDTLCQVSSDNLDAIMPGYTHLQRAQPITFAHHIMAYAMMFLRDKKRLDNTEELTLSMPLGSGALAATTYPINRNLVCELLGFNDVTHNSLDGVSDRDFVIELASDISIIMMHLSRFCEEIILWCSWEFKFIELDDSYSTGSSIMPQKKNPDIAELIRGKSGRVYGDLIALLTMMKGLPLAYNKDMQEDKEAIFDSVDTVKMCIKTFIPMLSTMKLNKDKMRMAAASGFINATDCADYLVKKGKPFRDAYKITGQLVAYCIKNNKTLESINLDEYIEFSPLFEDDIYGAINLEACVNQRMVLGGPSVSSVTAQIQWVKDKLSKIKE